MIDNMIKSLYAILLISLFLFAGCINILDKPDSPDLPIPEEPATNKTSPAKTEKITVDLKINGEDGPIQINEGETINVSWETTGDPTSCTAGTGWVGKKDPKGGSQSINSSNYWMGELSLTCYKSNILAKDSINVSLILKKGCKYNNPVCENDYECINNSCSLKLGCEFDNPECPINNECINNLCSPKAGCNYGNPFCNLGFKCINNTCIEEIGCAYNNPPCYSSDHECKNNQCVLKSGCVYSNPDCFGNSYCLDNSCQECNTPYTSSWTKAPANPKYESGKLLVILWDPHRPEHPAPGKSEIESLIFGPDPSVKGYFSANSGGKYTIEKTALLGWYDADKPADHYWNHKNYLNSYGGKCCEEGFIGGHSEKWAEAILRADADFDYSAYDTNHDGVLQNSELGILIVIPQNSPFGTNRPVVAADCPFEIPLVVDGVQVNVMAEAYIGNPPNLALVAHELSHLFLDAPDMYFNGFYPYAAGAFSLMDANHGGNPHLDPYNKLRLGWVNPKVVTQDGCYELNDVERSGDVLLLYDPRHADEFFLIENRQKADYYDSWLPDYGLGVWHIIENQKIYSKLSAPYGVSDATWSIVGSNEWGRRGIRMIRPAYGPPFNNYQALWDDSNGDIYLNWVDGRSSGFSIKKISKSGNKMNFQIDAPD